MYLRLGRDVYVQPRVRLDRYLPDRSGSTYSDRSQLLFLQRQLLDPFLREPVYHRGPESGKPHQDRRGLLDWWGVPRFFLPGVIIGRGVAVGAGAHDERRSRTSAGGGRWKSGQDLLRKIDVSSPRLDSAREPAPGIKVLTGDSTPEVS